MPRISNKKVTTGFVTGGYPFEAMQYMNSMALGADVEALWFGDHYINFYSPEFWTPETTPAAENLPSPDIMYDHVVMMSVTATQTQNTFLGTSVTEPGRHHPMALAQRFVSLDHLSKGHTILGIGSGEYENTVPYGIDFDTPVTRLEEALQIIRWFWANPGKPLEFAGKHWQMKDAYYDLPLYNDTPPGIYLAAHGPRMLKMTGKYADGWLPSVLPREGQYREMLSVIEASANEAGRSLENFVPCQLVPVVVTDDKAKTMELILKSPIAASTCMLMPDAAWKAHGKTHPLGEGHSGFYKIMPHAVTQAEMQKAIDSLTPELVESSFWVGDKEYLLKRCKTLVEEGAKHLVLMSMGGMFESGGLESFADFVRIVPSL